LCFFTAYNPEMIELTATQRRALRARAHALNPVVSVSDKGLSESVLKEIDRCLSAHELIKIRVYDCERLTRAAFLEQVCAALACAPVQHIGNILVVWREKPSVAPTARRPAGETDGRRSAKAQTTQPLRRRIAR
jgi:RNA-binding protein